jgi:hypothetical protein
MIVHGRGIDYKNILNMHLEVTCRHMMIQKLKTQTAQGPWIVFTFDTPIISKEVTNYFIFL